MTCYLLAYQIGEEKNNTENVFAVEHRHAIKLTKVIYSLLAVATIIHFLWWNNWYVGDCIFGHVINFQSSVISITLFGLLNALLKAVHIQSNNNNNKIK